MTGKPEEPREDSNLKTDDSTFETDPRAQWNEYDTIWLPSVDSNRKPPLHSQGWDKRRLRCDPRCAGEAFRQPRKGRVWRGIRKSKSQPSSACVTWSRNSLAIAAVEMWPGGLGLL